MWRLICCTWIGMLTAETFTLILFGLLGEGDALPHVRYSHAGLCPNEMNPNLWVDAQSTCHRECDADQVSPFLSSHTVTIRMLAPHPGIEVRGVSIAARQAGVSGGQQWQTPYVFLRYFYLCDSRRGYLTYFEKKMEQTQNKSLIGSSPSVALTKLFCFLSPPCNFTTCLSCQ